MSTNSILKIISDVLRRILMAIIAFLTGLNVITIVLQVVMRYFLGKSIAWTNELAGYSLAWITFLGATLITTDESHIGMDIIIKKLKPKPKLILKLTINALMLVVCYVLFVHGIGTVKGGLKTKLTALPGNMGIVVSVIPFSGLFMALAIISNLIRDIREYRINNTLTDTSEETDILYNDVPDEILKSSSEAFEDEDVNNGGDDI